MLEIAIWT